MKKNILLIVVLALLIALVLGTTQAYAETATSENYQDTEAYLLLKEICEQCPNRVAGQNEKAQEYLLDKMNEYSGTSAASLSLFHIGGDENGEEYRNIQLKLDKPDTTKQIIIGAHYDSTGEGANDNASGVAAVLLIMQKLFANYDKVPCDVVFVLFDAEEIGLFGSYDYINHMTQAEKDDTLVMFNLDVISNGDNLYVWCENKHTDLADLILENSQGITEKPYAKGVNIAMDSYGYGYYETIQNSDHTRFRLQGIPTALFFSGTYSYSPLSYAESSDPNKQTMNSSNDTFDNLNKNNKEQFVNRINAVVDAVCNTVLSEKFMSVGENARSQLLNFDLWYNAWWPKIIVLGILVILAVFVFLYYRKLQKKAILGTAEVKTGSVFKTPDADDIFTFKK